MYIVGGGQSVVCGLWSVVGSVDLQSTDYSLLTTVYYAKL